MSEPYTRDNPPWAAVVALGAAIVLLFAFLTIPWLVIEDGSYTIYRLITQAESLDLALDIDLSGLSFVPLTALSALVLAGLALIAPRYRHMTAILHMVLGIMGVAFYGMLLLNNRNAAFDMLSQAGLGVWVTLGAAFILALQVLLVRFQAAPPPLDHIGFAAKLRAYVLWFAVFLAGVVIIAWLLNIQLIAVAALDGLAIGAIFGLMPLGLAFQTDTARIGLRVWLACAIAGFALGLWGALIMIFITMAVIISYTYTDRDDPFKSRAAIEDVDFTETRTQMFTRQMAGLGQTVRSASHALVRNRAGFLGFLGLVFFFGMTIFGPSLREYEGRPQLQRIEPGAQTAFQGPSEEFPLGLDYQGRDILSHIIHGGQALIIVSVQAGVITTVIAVALGAMGALVGGLIDQIINAVANFILTVPQFPLLVVLAGLISFDDLFYLALLLSVLDWPTLMRAVRAQVLSLRERDYVEAAIVLDLGLPHIISREVLPQMISYIVISMIFSIRGAMYAIVGLVFLGLVPFNEPDWGIMIYMARQQGAFYLQEAVGMLLAPVLAIALFQLSLVLFTRSLEEVFNPRLRAGL